MTSTSGRTLFVPLTSPINRGGHQIIALSLIGVTSCFATAIEWTCPTSLYPASL